MLNEALNVVEAMEYERVGDIVTLKEILEDGERALVIGHTDEERVVRLAEPLLDVTIRPGDALLLEPRSGYVYEVVPKSEVEELVLEEVPDIDYEQDRRPGRPDRADPRRGRAPVPLPRPLQGARTAAAQGRPALRPARMRQDAHRQGRRQLARQEGRRGDRPARGQELLPQHQGPRAPQQVRRRDRAAHPPRLPARPGEGERGHPRHRLLRRDGVPLPHPRIRCQLGRGEHHRPAAARRDRRRGGPGERDRDRRLQPRGHDRPRHPAPRPPRREDQDRASGRRGGQGHLRQVPHRPPAAARRRPRRTRRLAKAATVARHDPVGRRADVRRIRGEPLPGGHLRQR